MTNQRTLRFFGGCFAIAAVIVAGIGFCQTNPETAGETLPGSSTSSTENDSAFDGRLPAKVLQTKCPAFVAKDQAPASALELVNLSSKEQAPLTGFNTKPQEEFLEQKLCEFCSTPSEEETPAPLPAIRREVVVNNYYYSEEDKKPAEQRPPVQNSPEPVLNITVSPQMTLNNAPTTSVNVSEQPVMKRPVSYASPSSPPQRSYEQRSMPARQESVSVSWQSNPLPTCTRTYPMSTPYSGSYYPSVCVQTPTPYYCCPQSQPQWFPGKHLLGFVGDVFDSAGTRSEAFWYGR